MAAETRIDADAEAVGRAPRASARAEFLVGVATIVSEILPRLREEPERYALGPHDGHPNAQANDRVARWFVHEILGEDAEAP